MPRYIVSLDDDTRRIQCDGPYRLQEWIDEGYIKEKSWCFDRKSKEWKRAGEIVRSNRSRTSLDIYSDVDQTISDLGDLASQIKEMLRDGK